MTLAIRKFKRPAIFFALLILLQSILQYGLANEVSSEMTQPTSQTNQVEIKVDESLSRVIQLNQINYQQFLKLNEHIVIYFYAKDCQFCSEFNLTFAQMERIHRLGRREQKQNISFAKLQLTQKTQQIFKHLRIDAVPEMKYFYKGKPSVFSYLFNDYSNSPIFNHMRWIQRVIRVSKFEDKISQTHRLSIFGNLNKLKDFFYIPEISTIQEVAQSLKQVKNKRFIVFNCSYQEKQSENKELSTFLKKIYLENLELDFYCTQNHQALDQDSNTNYVKSSNELFLNVHELDSQKTKIMFVQKILLQNKSQDIFDKQKNDQINLSSDQNNQHFGLSSIYHSNFIRYLNKEMQQWTDKAAIDIFSKNNSGFIFIMNNQTESKKLFAEYKKIKENLNLNYGMSDAKLYYSDLSITPQQTTRIKKYIFGIEISIKKSYPYPALAYIQPTSNYVKKYVFPTEREMNSKLMEQWMLKVIRVSQGAFKHEQKQDKNPLHAVETQEPSIPVKEHFRTTPDDLFPEHYLQLFESIYYNDAYTLEQKQEKLKIPEKFFDDSHKFSSMNFKDFKILLSEVYNRPFFAFVNCRNDFKSYQLFTEVSDWIQEIQDQQSEKQTQEQAQKQNQNVQKKPKDQKSHQKHQKPHQQTTMQVHPLNNAERILSEIQQDPEKNTVHEQQKNQQQMAAQKIFQEKQVSPPQKPTLSERDIYLLNFNNNDYPPTYTDSDGKTHELKVEYFPTLVYFSEDKKTMKKLEGVQDLSQIKQFVKAQLLESNNKNQQQETSLLVKAEQVTQKDDFGQSDRDLEGQIQPNIEKSLIK